MLNEDVIAVVKNIAVWISFTTSAIALVTLIVKPVRARLATFILGMARTDKLEDDVKQLEQQIADFQTSVMASLATIQRENAEQTEKLSLCIEGSQAALGNSIKHIYYKYLPDKSLPSKEWEACVTLHAVYKQLGGNHYVDALYTEMQDWVHMA